jgi:hypothetical protein
MVRAARRQARERALRRLLHAVREANWQRDREQNARIA